MKTAKQAFDEVMTRKNSLDTKLSNFMLRAEVKIEQAIINHYFDITVPMSLEEYNNKDLVATVRSKLKELGYDNTTTHDTVAVGVDEYEECDHKMLISWHNKGGK